MLLAIGNDGQFARFCEAATSHNGHGSALCQQHPAGRKPREPDTGHGGRHPHPHHGAVDCAAGDKAVPCGPINSVGQAFADAQVVSRNLVVNQAAALVDTPHAAIKGIATVASPLRLSDTPPALLRAPPALGEHTDEVLAGLGLDAADIGKLRQQRVV
jgi:crotonobetainyl-CoA:carnitine CoA-transferase CaiB-like acyl-CoA transferase